MKPCSYPVAQLLPHAAPMLLLDDAIAWGDDAIQTGVTVREDSLFFRAGHGIAAHVALEWMAQTCGAYIGALSLARGQAVRIGYLLGTRDFLCERRWFRLGETFHIYARLLFRDDEMGVFECRVVDAAAGTDLAHAQLTVYQPAESSQALRDGGSQGVPR